jgi:hypothetical protein
MGNIGFIRKVNGKLMCSYWTNGTNNTADRYIKLHSGRRVHVRPGDYVIFEGSKLYQDLDYLPDYTGTLQLEIE